jgi:hypothetical protein
MSGLDPIRLAQLAAIESHRDGDTAPLVAVLRSAAPLAAETREYLAQILQPRQSARSPGRPTDPLRDRRDFAVREAYFRLIDNGVLPAQAKRELAGRRIWGSFLSVSSIESIVGNKRREICVRPARPRPTSK